MEISKENFIKIIDQALDLKDRGWKYAISFGDDAYETPLDAIGLCLKVLEEHKNKVAQ
jgi:hypothetical protein